MNNSSQTSLPQILDMGSLRLRHSQKQNDLKIDNYMGVMIIDGLSVAVQPNGSLSMTTRPQRQPEAELIIVLTKENPPSPQLLSSVLRSIPNSTARTRIVGFGVNTQEWDDYNLRTAIDSLLFLDFPEYFPEQTTGPQTPGIINLMPSAGAYVVDYYRDTPRMGMVTEPDKLAFGVVHRVAVR